MWKHRWRVANNAAAAAKHLAGKASLLREKLFWKFSWDSSIVPAATLYTEGTYITAPPKKNDELAKVMQVPDYTLEILMSGHEGLE